MPDAHRASAARSRVRPRHLLPALALALATPLPAQMTAPRATSKPTVAQFLSPASPLEVTSAKRADRIAWAVYEEGKRNVYTAAAPDFRPVRVTRFLEDDGQEVTDVALSDDGSVVIFVRGSAPNRDGWVANPLHDPRGSEQAVWAARTAGGPAWRVAEGSAPELSPDGRWILLVRQGQIYRARVAQGPITQAADTAGEPFIVAWGRQSSARWSPDGSKIAFVSDRSNHSLIGVYDVRTRKVDFLSPSVDCDASPTWSPDSRRIAFTRRPGTPFGLQAQTGGGGIGNPPGPATAQRGGGAANPFGGCAGGGGFARGGGAGPRGGAAADTAPANPLRRVPGLFAATFAGGHTLSLMVADISTGETKEFWHNQPGDRLWNGIGGIRWAGDNVIFSAAMPDDEWDRWFSLPIAGGVSDPILLTPTNGLIEDATAIAVSADGRTFYYCTNAGDIERRHIWAVPTAGGTPRQVSTGDGIETYPMPLASGDRIAVLYFNARQPASIGLVAAQGGAPRVIFPTLTASFPAAAHVVPQIVLTRAGDGLEIHNQLFLPADLSPGEKRPALIFVHGGPMRQMLPGYHYMQFYHWAYAINQWLANQGYVVLSINYRGGIGYGRSFRQAPNTNARGNSEYQDVLAGAQYLQGRADVDASRIGIWGLSYGGLLTSQALARNSDIFVAGADLAGVHLYGANLDTASVAWRSSAISEIGKWKSPVFLVHGDDDRNVDFSQTIGLVQLLRAHGVHYELMVIPDDLHESMIHSRWLDTWERMGAFLRRFVWDRAAADR
jgi:dipeptidyl aminopeptidase/acylaminoacyl peptidase